MPKEGFVQTQWGKMDFNGLYINIYIPRFYIQYIINTVFYIFSFPFWLIPEGRVYPPLIILSTSLQVSVRLLQPTIVPWHYSKIQFIFVTNKFVVYISI